MLTINHCEWDCTSIELNQASREKKRHQLCSLPWSLTPTPRNSHKDSEPLYLIDSARRLPLWLSHYYYRRHPVPLMLNQEPQRPAFFWETTDTCMSKIGKWKKKTVKACHLSRQKALWSTYNKIISRNNTNQISRITVRMSHHRSLQN